MSFGGSGNDSSTSPVTTTTTTNADNRIVADGGSIAIGAGSSNNTILDGGAINAAFEFAGNNNAIAGENYDNLLETTNSALQGFFSLGANATGNYKSLLDSTNSTMSGLLNGIASTQNFISSTAADASGSIDNKTIAMLGLGAMAVIAVVMMRKKA